MRGACLKEMGACLVTSPASSSLSGPGRVLQAEGGNCDLRLSRFVPKWRQIIKMELVLSINDYLQGPGRAS